MDLPSIPPASGRGPDFGRRFCPRCGRVEWAGPILCRECGEVLASQGYCAVCEAFWALVPGTPCPKHEVALATDAPVPAEGFSPANREEWVTVASFADALGAEAPRIRLESEGIPTF